MASEQRRKAIAAGKIVESSDAVRRRRRQEASIAREELAIELFAQGKTSAQISETLFERFGVRLESDIPGLVRRGLYRRVENGSANHEAARELFVQQYRELIEVYMPRALGHLDDPETGLKTPPDLRAADLVLKVLDKLGVVLGVVAPTRSGDINLNILNVPGDADVARAKILDSLQRDMAKQKQIEGALAGTPATLTEHPDAQDGKILPPTLVAPKERTPKP